MPQMSPRQAAFRLDYRTRIAPAYAGWLHVALIFGLGGAAMAFPSASKVLHWLDE